MTLDFDGKILSAEQSGKFKLHWVVVLVMMCKAYPYPSKHSKVDSNCSCHYLRMQDCYGAPSKDI